MARQVRSIAKEFPDLPRLEVVTLYAAKPAEHQQQVFKRMRGELSQGELFHI